MGFRMQPRRQFMAAILALVQVVTAGAATAWLVANDDAAIDGREAATFATVRPGQCLTWSQASPDRLSQVDCADEHRFEVAGTIDSGVAAEGTLNPEADHRQCQAVVDRYLGTRYDPKGRFTVGVVWSPADGPALLDPQRALCGLQLPGAGSAQLAFKGRVVDLDQAKVWPAGTCLGIDVRTHQSNDVAVECTKPHAVEVTGTVTLTAAFSAAPPADADQEAFITTVCTPITDDYLGAATMPATGLTLAHARLTPASWMAGTREVACRIGVPGEAGGWATLVGSASGGLQINGQPASQATSAAAPPAALATARAQITSPGRHDQSPIPPTPHGVVAAPNVDNPEQAPGPVPGAVDGAPAAEAPAGAPPPAEPPLPPPAAPAPPPPAEPAPDGAPIA
jgi:hypothetical protein